MNSVAIIGETLALIELPNPVELDRGSTVPRRIGGAESNVAIGLARLGVPSTWISRVGDDGLGVIVTRAELGGNHHTLPHGPEARQESRDDR